MNKQFQAVSDLMKKEVEAGRLFGCAVTVGDRNGEIFSDQYGDIGGNTLCRLYSMSKSFACVAAWRLIEQGKLHPDDKVTEYMPYFDHLVIVDDKGTRPAKNAITIRDLMNMTTGIPYTPVAVKIFTEPSMALLKTIREQLGRFQAGEPVTSEDIYHALAENPIEFEPGTSYRYGMSVDILGGIMEMITGKRLHELYTDEFLRPLGMGHTGFRYDKDVQFAKMSEFGEDGRVRELTAQEMYPCDYPDGRSFGDSAGGGWFFETTYGGMYSTRDDLSRFARMLLRGGELDGQRILTPETVEGFSHNQLPPDALAVYDSYTPGAGYGYNSYLRVLMDDTQTKAPSRAGEFAGSGYMGSHYSVDPKSGLYIVYMQQRNEKPDIFEDLRRLVYQAM